MLDTIRDRTDAEIEAEVAEDPSVAPITVGEAWRGAELISPELTVVVTVRIDRQVLEFFRTHGADNPEVAMAAVLKAHVDENG